MRRPRVSDVAFAALLVACIVMAVFAFLVWQGHFVHDGPGPDTGSADSRTSAPRPAQPALPSNASETTPVAAAGSEPDRVTIVARRGDCWIVAHAGSKTGPALIERVLRQGETVNLRGRRIWLELGAAGNVDVTVNRRLRPIPSGTTNVLLG